MHATASAGSAPAASLKHSSHAFVSLRKFEDASAGSAPAASLKPDEDVGRPDGAGSIRGVCPRGLIEAAVGSHRHLDQIQRIRGVCPRGLIEARCRPCSGMVCSASASAGSAPAASLKRRALPRGLWTRVASAGSAPAASLKRPVAGRVHRLEIGIRGVCPRGLIEASSRHSSATRPRAASAGSAPAASLKHLGGGRHGAGRCRGRIRGVCPRGLIEASSWRASASTAITAHPRGLPPRPH